MALDALVRRLVGTTGKITDSLKVEIKHYRAKGMSDTGSSSIIPRYTIRKGFWETKQVLVRTEKGDETKSMDILTFTEPFEIDREDQLVLPDGTSQPILDIGGFADKKTGRPYVMVVTLG